MASRPRPHPGGGLTMTVSVPAVTEPGYEYEPGHREREAVGEPEGRGAAGGSSQ